MIVSFRRRRNLKNRIKMPQSFGMTKTKKHHFSKQPLLVSYFTNKFDTH